MTNTKWRVYVAATYDTKGHEAEYVAGLLARDGLDVVTVDVSTTGASSAARVQARGWPPVIRAARRRCSLATVARPSPPWRWPSSATPPPTPASARCWAWAARAARR